MLHLAKVILQRIVCIVSAFCLTGTQKSSCFLLNHFALDLILLHHLDNFVLHSHSLFWALFSGLILSSVILEVALNQISSLKNYISDILFHNRYFLKGTIMQA